MKREYDLQFKNPHSKKSKVDQKVPENMGNVGQAKVLPKSSKDLNLSESVMNGILPWAVIGGFAIHSKDS